MYRVIGRGEGREGRRWGTLPAADGSQPGVGPLITSWTPLYPPHPVPTPIVSDLRPGPLNEEPLRGSTGRRGLLWEKAHVVCRI